MIFPLSPQIVVAALVAAVVCTLTSQPLEVGRCVKVALMFALSRWYIYYLSIIYLSVIVRVSGVW